MVDIEPFKFQKSTNIEEHNQMKDKINEMVEVINNVNLDNLPSQINALETEVATQGNEIDALQVTVNTIPATYAKKTEIPDVSDFITADALTPYAKITDVDNADISAIDASINNGEITIKLTRPDGDMSDSIDCPFIQTATLIPTSTARAFKIRFTYTDGTQYDTNEFVIPEGGGTDVSVTGVTVGDGTAPNSFKVAIQLSDASTINSNDYVIEFPENTDTYPTTLTATLSGTTLNMTIGLNNGSNVLGTANLDALLTGYATTSYVDGQVATRLDKTTADGYYQPKGNYLTSVPIGGTAIGGVKNGGDITIEADGTMSVTGGSSGGITLITDSLANHVIIDNEANTVTIPKSLLIEYIFKDDELNDTGRYRSAVGFVPAQTITNLSGAGTITLGFAKLEVMTNLSGYLQIKSDSGYNGLSVIITNQNTTPASPNITKINSDSIALRSSPYYNCYRAYMIG